MHSPRSVTRVPYATVIHTLHFACNTSACESDLVGPSIRPLRQLSVPLEGLLGTADTGVLGLADVAGASANGDDDGEVTDDNPLEDSPPT